MGILYAALLHVVDRLLVDDDRGPVIDGLSQVEPQAPIAIDSEAGSQEASSSIMLPCPRPRIAREHWKDAHGAA